MDRVVAVLQRARDHPAGTAGDVPGQAAPELAGGEHPGGIPDGRDLVVVVPPGAVVVDPAEEGGERGPGLLGGDGGVG